jgi:hypothetical protein
MGTENIEACISIASDEGHSECCCSEAYAELKALLDKIKKLEGKKMVLPFSDPDWDSDGCEDYQVSG